MPISRTGLHIAGSFGPENPLGRVARESSHPRESRDSHHELGCEVVEGAWDSPLAPGTTVPSEPSPLGLAVMPAQS
jgi:hypothetical protein